MRKVFVVIAIAAALASCSSSAPTKVHEYQAKVLSKVCDEALEPVRIYASSHTEAITEEVRAEMKARLTTSYDFCSQAELKLFRDTFLTPWAESIAEAGSKAG